ncbi:MAG: hypothetical protein GF370_00395 [Candidatus Nealsonbacteria bacterium]|nr:hypothetical protein [Candidatus Nealsonbacteria bacterium]
MKEKGKRAISQDEFLKMMSKKGEVRGVSLEADAEFILKRKGEKGLAELEKTFAQLDYPLAYKEIRTGDFYPLGLKAATLLAVKRIFDFKEEDFIEMGRFGASLPQVMRIFLRFFGSPSMLARSAPRMFRKYYTVGKLSVTDFSEQEKYARTKIENFDLSPLHCQCHIGYLSRMVEMIVKSTATCRESKCIHRGDEYHEFLIHW